jgi:hypothetical protein
MFAVSLYHGESAQVSVYFAFYISNRVCEWWVVEADAYVFGAGLATPFAFLAGRLSQLIFVKKRKANTTNTMVRLNMPQYFR